MNSNVHTYLTYLAKEVVSPTVYVFACIIGSTICFLTNAFSPIPFLVPLVVQIMVRSSVKFRMRHRDALVELPAQKEDPVFIMDTKGNIILSVGKTRELFEKFDVKNITSFINEGALDRIIASAVSGILEPAGVEVFSNMTLKWYEVKATTAAMTYGDQSPGEKSPKILVWFQDITLRQVYYLRLKDLLRYSDALIDALETDKTGTAGPAPASRHMAVFLLKEYQGVFIGRVDSSGDLDGIAYRVEDHAIAQSDPIRISSQSEDPVNLSRCRSRIMSDNASAWDSRQAFWDAHAFDPRVMAFLDRPVRNFITYNEGDISVIAFNFRSRIAVHEREFFKVAVNIFRTMTMIADLKAGGLRENRGPGDQKNGSSPV